MQPRGLREIFAVTKRRLQLTQRDGDGGGGLKAGANCRAHQVHDRAELQQTDSDGEHAHKECKQVGCVHLHSDQRNVASVVGGTGLRAQRRQRGVAALRGSCFRCGSCGVVERRHCIRVRRHNARHRGLRQQRHHRHCTHLQVHGAGEQRENKNRHKVGVCGTGPLVSSSSAAAACKQGTHRGRKWQAAPRCRRTKGPAVRSGK